MKRDDQARRERDAGSGIRNRVRGRAIDHLRELLRRAAMGGAAVGLGTSVTGCPPVVCDPLPPPICDPAQTPNDQLARYVTAVASWQASDGGLVVSVAVSANSRGSPLTFGQNPALTGATLLQVQDDSANRTRTVTCLPNAGVTKVTITQAADCEGRAVSFRIDLNVSAAPSAGAAIPSTVSVP